MGKNKGMSSSIVDLLCNENLLQPKQVTLRKSNGLQMVKSTYGLALTRGFKFEVPRRLRPSLVTIKLATHKFQTGSNVNLVDVVAG